MTIQRRLWLGLALGLTAVVVAAGLLLYHVTEDTLERGMDAALDARLDALAEDLELGLVPAHEREFTRLGAAVLRRPAGHPVPETERARLRALADEALEVRLRHPLAGDARSDATVRYEVRSADGTALLASRDRGEPGAATRTRTRVVEDVPFRGAHWGASWGEVRARLGLPPRSVEIVARHDRGAADAVLAGLARWIVLAGAGVLLAGTALVLLTVRRGLAPLRRLADEVGRLGGTTPLRRVELPDEPADLEPVVRALNASLDRLATSMERERRVSAHMAHELRTPVAELTNITDVARRWPDDAALRAECVEQCADIARHMERVVATLLRMARSRDGADAARFREIPLDALLRDALAAVEAQARRRKLRLDVRVQPGARACADPDVLRSILDNLLTNATRCAPEGTRVTVLAEGAGDRTRLGVANEAPRLAPADLPHLADPFWRAEAHEGEEEAGHVGLGLTLVEELARASGIGFDLALREGRLEARLTLPRDLASLQ